MDKFKEIFVNRNVHPIKKNLERRVKTLSPDHLLSPVIVVFHSLCLLRITNQFLPDVTVKFKTPGQCYYKPK